MPKEILKFRDEAWQIYHTSKPFLDKIEKNFGLKARRNITNMSKIKLKRKIYVKNIKNIILLTFELRDPSRKIRLEKLVPVASRKVHSSTFLLVFKDKLVLRPKYLSFRLPQFFAPRFGGYLTSLPKLNCLCSDGTSATLVLIMFGSLCTLSIVNRYSPPTLPLPGTHMSCLLYTSAAADE